MDGKDEACTRANRVCMDSQVQYEDGTDKKGAVNVARPLVSRKRIRSITRHIFQCGWLLRPAYLFYLYHCICNLAFCIQNSTASFLSESKIHVLYQRKQ